MAVDCLALAAHPDDLEITSGGLLAKMTDLGHRVVMLDLTAGEMGTRGSAEIRVDEAAAAARVLGVAERGNLQLPDSHLVADLATRKAVAQKIRDFQPKLLLLPHWQQRHPDHRVCSQVGYDACFYAGLRKAELAGEPHRPRKILYSTYYHTNVQPTFAVDISDQFERKLEAVRCYQSQFEGQGGANRIFIPGVDIFDYIRTRDHELGMRVRAAYAEGYVQKELMTVADPLELGGVSI